MPTLSVVIPLYNKVEFVARSVVGALGQSFGDIEVIVIDDGSTDGSAERLDSFCDPRLIVVRQPNAGVSAARNLGIRMARSDWVAFLDADDDWDPDHLALLWQARTIGNVVAAFSNVRLESRQGATLIASDVPAQRIIDYFDFALRNGGYPSQTSGMLVRKSAALEVGLFPVGVSLGEDIDLWCRLALIGPMIYTGRATAVYNDVPRPTNVARNLTRRPEAPAFAKSFQQIGKVPEHLLISARRYLNFLQLEYARQLIDRGYHGEARDVLRSRCTLSMDPMRYLRRYARTFALGRLAFRLSGGRVQPV